MRNKEVADLLNKIADYLELNEEGFKVRAYRKAALVVEGLSDDIFDVWKNGRLEELHGIGEGIAKTISDFLKKGKSKYFIELKKKTPIDVDQLGKIEGLGPKTLLKLYKKLKVKNLKDLERVIKKKEIRKLEGMGELSEKNILKSIKFTKSSKGGVSLGEALPVAEEIVLNLKKQKFVLGVDVCGSLRRGKETIGDVDILVASQDSKKVIEFFSTLDNVKQVLSKGSTKSSVRITEGLQVDLRVVEKNIYGAALNYFTGNKEHNIVLRKIAIQKGFKLSEYGLFDKKNNRLVGGKTEKDIYKKLGMEFIPPELRENEGEFEAAKKGNLPRLINQKDLRGDLQMHSTWSDGNGSVEEMAIAAKKIGHEYIAITDHGGKLKIANALNLSRIKKQFKEIKKVSKKLRFPILKGVEVDIKANGRMGLSNPILKQFDIVVGSIHSGFREDKNKATKRLVSAMENEHVDIIGHPTGRLIGKRKGVDFEWAEIFQKAKQTKTVFEINSYPSRLDLSDVNIRRAINSGVKLVISTDAHNIDNLRLIKYGITTARRGWAEKKHVINTRKMKDMIKLLK